MTHELKSRISQKFMKYYKFEISKPELILSLSTLSPTSPTLFSFSASLHLSSRGPSNLAANTISPPPLILFLHSLSENHFLKLRSPLQPTIFQPTTRNLLSSLTSIVHELTPTSPPTITIPCMQAILEFVATSSCQKNPLFR